MRHHTFHKQQLSELFLLIICLIAIFFLCSCNNERISTHIVETQQAMYDWQDNLVLTYGGYKYLVTDELVLPERINQKNYHHCLFW